MLNSMRTTRPYARTWFFSLWRMKLCILTLFPWPRLICPYRRWILFSTVCATIYETIYAENKCMRAMVHVTKLVSVFIRLHALLTVAASISKRTFLQVTLCGVRVWSLNFKRFLNRISSIWKEALFPKHVVFNNWFAEHSSARAWYVFIALSLSAMFLRPFKSHPLGPWQLWCSFFFTLLFILLQMTKKKKHEMHELERHFTHNECSHRFTPWEKMRQKKKNKKRFENLENALFCISSARKEHSTFGNSGATWLYNPSNSLLKRISARVLSALLCSFNTNNTISFWRLISTIYSLCPLRLIPFFFFFYRANTHSLSLFLTRWVYFAFRWFH